MGGRIERVRGDITRQQVDAIVNAANQALLGGGGVDGAIHRAAGPELLEACRRLPELRAGVRCPTGEVRVTPGFGLRARWVIHTVGPVWSGGSRGEDGLLASCYRNALAAAIEVGAGSVAFPSISTGLYGFPVERAARIAVETVSEFLDGDEGIDPVLFICFDEANDEAYRALLGEGE
jgi:O-acetyl-ADP-ribose deacetylase (regulator of RNase III)